MVIYLSLGLDDNLGFLLNQCRSDLFSCFFRAVDVHIGRARVGLLNSQLTIDFSDIERDTTIATAVDVDVARLDKLINREVSFGMHSALIVHIRNDTIIHGIAHQNSFWRQSIFKIKRRELEVVYIMLNTVFLIYSYGEMIFVIGHIQIAIIAHNIGLNSTTPIIIRANLDSRVLLGANNRSSNIGPVV